MKIDAEVGQTLDNFRGLNNVDATHKFPMGKGTFLQLAINCDVDDNGKIRRRWGIDQRISGASHSAWSNPSETICLYVRNGKLCRLEEDFSETILGSVDTQARMAFVEVFDKVFYSNAMIIGYYKNSVMNSLPAVTQEFKQTMRPGYLLEWYNSRLYVAHDNVIYFSDATVPMVWDKRKNFIPMLGHITMIKAVRDGIYVSCLGDGTYFLGGSDPFEFVAIKITDSHAYLYSAVAVQGEDLGEAGQQALGTAIFWTSSEGVYRGLAGGRVKNVTGDYYTPAEDATMGAALYREDLDYNQYIFTYNFEQDNNAEINIPHPTIVGVGTIS